MIRKLSTLKVVIVQTCNGGLHVYCRSDPSNDLIPKTTNRFTKIYEDESIAIDLFTDTNIGSECRSFIVGPTTKARNKQGEIATYEFVVGDWNTPIESTVTEVIDALGYELNFEKYVH